MHEKILQKLQIQPICHWRCSLTANWSDFYEGFYTIKKYLVQLDLEHSDKNRSQYISFKFPVPNFPYQ